MHQPVDRPFEVALRDLISQEMSRPGHDPGAVIERLAHATGFVIATSTGGDATKIDLMLTASAHYTAEVAASLAPLGKVVSVMRSVERGESGNA